MQIQRVEIKGEGFAIPGVMITPRKVIGAAVIAHGYGGCKEEQLGLAWRVAEQGLVACAIDLRGHGEHRLPLDENVLDDMEAAVDFCRKFGRVVAIGHSLGGRLAMMSGADNAIGVSPPTDRTYSEKTQETLRKLRHNKVRADRENKVFDILKEMPEWQRDDRRTLIVYGSRDVPEIVAACDELRKNGANAVRIEGALHGDTYLMEAAYVSIARQLEEWFDIERPFTDR
ncbi:MAG: Alpha/beta hydrolase family protein [Methanomassiliicoccales archaeon PtaU1.Bin124]|nr:MAG: Alpha/beta hydrolase family protein [Methanomassiliicoccales archaeon PtaU1.Bin124]